MGNKCQVLMVEDDMGIANFMSTILLSNNYGVLRAKNGETCFDDGFVVLSGCYPSGSGPADIDGLDVVRQVRTWSRIPIIVVSAVPMKR